MSTESILAIIGVIATVIGATWKIGAAIGGVRLEIQALRTEMGLNYVRRDECRERHAGGRL